MTNIEKMREANADLLALAPELIRSASITAQITQAKFEALRKEGFTDARALELCRTGSAFY